MKRLTVLLVAVLAVTLDSASRKFYPDDPIWVDDDSRLDASKTLELEDTNGYDFLVHTFSDRGERRDVRALNVNTLDEVPDSSWFTNRIGRRDMPIADIVRGPDQLDGVNLEGWVVSGGKGGGVQPGFRMADPKGQIYQIEVDPPSNPEMASGAETIGTSFYYAFGYHTVEVYLAELDPSKIVIAPKATIRDPLNGTRRPLTRRDIDDVLRQGARLENGNYRVLASRFAPGQPRGNFRYYGTRPDDPNDIVPHEHRRELRAARVFAAWLNHDDSRGINSLDMLEQKDGRGWIKHYMFDFGSILGSGTVFAQKERAGNEYIFDAKPGWATLATFGLYVRPWMLIDYPDVPPAIGRFEGDAFEPEKWKPEYPNPAFENMRPDDGFWAARIVSRFTDKAIRAVVEKARYSDPRATEYMTLALMKRRDKVVRYWINRVNPVVDLVLSSTGTLTFTNAAVAAGAATPAESYTLQWFHLDNAVDQRKDVGDKITVAGMTAQAPAGVLQGSDYIGVTMTARHAQHPDWAKPEVFYFRRAASGWEWVGAERE